MLGRREGGKAKVMTKPAPHAVGLAWPHLAQQQQLLVCMVQQEVQELLRVLLLLLLHAGACRQSQRASTSHSCQRRMHW